YLVVGTYDEMSSALNQLHFYFRNFDPDVFDWQWYLGWNSDVAASYPRQEDAEFHWNAMGIGENRSCSSTFSPARYLQNYIDISNYCGATNYQCAIDHYVASGRSEGRTGQ